MKLEWKARRECFSGKNGEKCLLLRQLNADQAEAAMELQCRVWRSMPDPSQLAETSVEEICESAEEDLCLGAFDGDHLMAFSLMVVNRESAARNAGQKNGFDPLECVTFDTVFVDPDCRGLGLQQYFFARQEEIALELGAKYIFATVAPDNLPSLNNMLACGFEIRERKLLYGNRDRYVMVKKIKKNGN